MDGFAGEVVEAVLIDFNAGQTWRVRSGALEHHHTHISLLNS
jgi:hypothetical protein